MRTLLVGGAGLIGRHVAHALIERGEQVTVLDPVAPARPVDGARYVQAGLSDPAAVSDGLRGVHRIAHLAAVTDRDLPPSTVIRRNVLDTTLLLEALPGLRRRPQRLVVVSCAQVYGEGEYECAWHGRLAPEPRGAGQLYAERWDPRCTACNRKLEPRPTRETSPLLPATVEAIAKRDQEALALTLAPQAGISTLAVRLFEVYGGATGTVAEHARALRDHQPPQLAEDGRQTRDLLHVTDAASGVIAALDGQAHGRAINIATGQPTHLCDVATQLAEYAGIPVEAEATSRPAPGQPRHLYGDTTVAANLLGWRAQVTLDQGLAEVARQINQHRQAAAA